MALFPEFSVENTPKSPEEAFRFPVGVASPLWLAFAGAASAGVAYWLMTRWSRPSNLEAFGGWFDKAAPDGTVLPEPIAAAAVAVDEQTKTVVEDTQAVIAETAEAATETAEELTSATVEATESAQETAETVQDEVLEAAEETAATTAAVADDLTRIVGIGPKLAARLSDLGVKSFSDMAGWTADDLARFDKEMDLKGRAVRDAWVVQARRFAKA